MAIPVIDFPDAKLKEDNRVTITQETVRRLAHLARIELDSTESIEAIQADLSRIVTMIDQISKANTETIDPVRHPLEETFGAKQLLREDDIKAIPSTAERDKLLALAKKSESGLYLVPHMMEET